MEPNQTMLVLAALAAGALAPFLVQLLKGRLSGVAALLLAYGVCLVIGVLIAFAGGMAFPPVTEPIAFVAALAQLMGVANLIAQIIYKAWLEKWTSGVLANKNL